MFLLKVGTTISVSNPIVELRDTPYSWVKIPVQLRTSSKTKIVVNDQVTQQSFNFTNIVDARAGRFIGTVYLCIFYTSEITQKYQLSKLFDVKVSSEISAMFSHSLKVSTAGLDSELFDVKVSSVFSARTS
jgi:hypothetical protein